MASIYKRKRAKKWTIAYYDHNGKRQTVRGFSDKQATERYAVKLEDEADKRRRGYIDHTQERFLENERLPLEEHLEDFERHLEANGGTPKHVRNTKKYVELVFNICGFKVPAEIDAAKVSVHLAELRRSKKVGVRAVNARVTAAKSFTRWLDSTGRVRCDALKSLKRDTAGERSDRKRVRRALTDKEIGKLIHAAETGPEFMGMTGYQRSVLYQLALGTGLRAGEIGSLTPRDFDLTNPQAATVTVRAAYSKHRREDVLPLRSDLAKRLAAFIAQAMKHPEARLFDLPNRTAELLAFDLERAGIKAKDTADRVCDFHALRHTFITRLARSGVSPAVAKTLARHSTITLTMDRYTHTLIADERAALDKLPTIEPQAADQALAATGTEGGGEESAAHLQRAERPACPQVTPSDVIDQRDMDREDVAPVDRKPRKDKDFGNACHEMTASETVGEENAPPGTRTPDPLIKSQLLYQLS